jgi:hypothetical protein
MWSGNRCSFGFRQPTSRLFAHPYHFRLTFALINAFALIDAPNCNRRSQGFAGVACQRRLSVFRTVEHEASESGNDSNHRENKLDDYRIGSDHGSFDREGVREL